VLDVKVFLVILNTQQAHRDAYHKTNIIFILAGSNSVGTAILLRTGRPIGYSSIPGRCNV